MEAGDKTVEDTIPDYERTLWQHIGWLIGSAVGRLISPSFPHKTHEKCVEILLARQSVIKIWQIVPSSITTAGFVGVILGSGHTGAIAGAFVSTALLALNANTKSSELGELAQKHKQAANDLWLIRENYVSLLTDIRMNESPIEKLQSQRDLLIDQLHSVYCGAPTTTFKAYTSAQKSLKEFEALTFHEEEIGAFPPKELKRSTYEIFGWGFERT